jgi:hypothetical protein
VYRAKWEIMKQRISSLPPPEKKPPHWRDVLSTDRARLSHRRTRMGIRSIAVLLSEEHLDALCKLEFLQPDQRASRTAISQALARYLNSALVVQFFYTGWAQTAREQRAKKSKPVRETPR